MAARAVTPLRRGLAPVLDTATRVLVMGSFPSEASLAAGEYYAHPRNHFWPVMAVLTGEPLRERPYAQRIAALRAHGIGLWDTIVACRRDGSLDAAIRDATRAELARIRRMAPQVALVAFNGTTAARAAPAFAAAGYATLALPSTSPAHTMPFATKLAAWQALAERLAVAA